jgi:hypothetical protein
MSAKPAIKSVFAPMTAKKLAHSASIKPSPAKSSPVPSAKSGDEIIKSISFFLEITDNPQKHCPCWCYIADPRHPDYGTRLTAVLNTAHWPTAAAIQRKDWRAIRWLTSLAILERIALSSYPVWLALKAHLGSVALGTPRPQNWELVL